jgi:uncharacterized protein (TIGR02996 family)
MTHEDVFLAEILASPEDDTPRLIYADWLDDHGQYDRAELIRVQCELARMEEGHPRWAGLEAFEGDLLAHNGEAWLGELRPFVSRWTFRRGFLDEVAVPPRVYLENDSVPYPPTVRRIGVDLDGFEIPPEVIEYVPESVARENVCVPLGFRGPTILLALQLPDDMETLARLEFILNRPVEPVAADTGQVREAIGHHYGAVEVESVECVLYEFPVFEGQLTEEDPLVVRLLDSILSEAATRKATEVRIEPGPDYFQILFRIDGKWSERDRPPRRLLSSLVARIRIGAHLDLATTGEQTGRMSGAARGVPFDCGVRIRPSENGPRVFLYFGSEPAG